MAKRSYNKDFHEVGFISGCTLVKSTKKAKTSQYLQFRENKNSGMNI